MNITVKCQNCGHEEQTDGLREIIEIAGKHREENESLRARLSTMDDIIAERDKLREMLFRLFARLEPSTPGERR